MLGAAQISRGLTDRQSFGYQAYGASKLFKGGNRPVVGGIFVPRNGRSLWRESGSSNARGWPLTVLSSRRHGGLKAPKAVSHDAVKGAKMTALKSSNPETLISESLKTTSLAIASRFGRAHDKIVTIIESLEVPAEYHAAHFGEMVREIEIGSGAKRKQRYYELTRDGFALLIMGFTGKKAMAWKIKFLEAFNDMEARLSTPHSEGLEYSRLGNSPKLVGTEQLDKLIAYLETMLLDNGMAGNQYEALRSVHCIALSLRGNTPPPSTVPVRAHSRKLRGAA